MVECRKDVTDGWMIDGVRLVKAVKRMTVVRERERERERERAVSYIYLYIYIYSGIII